MKALGIGVVVLSTGLSISACATRHSGGDSPANVSEDTLDHSPQTASNSVEAAAAALPVKPDFSGHWVLDPKASDDPEEKLQAAKAAMAGGRGGPGGMGRGQGGGGMGGGGRGRNSPSAMKREKRLSLGETFSLLSALESLEISHEDPLLTIAGPDGERQRVFTDFRGASISSNGGPQQRVTIAGWDREVLVVETTPNSGPRLIQRYHVEPDVRQLVIESEVALPKMKEPLRIRYVYDLVAP